MRQYGKVRSHIWRAICLVWMLCLLCGAAEPVKSGAAEQYVYDNAVLLQDASMLEDRISELRIQLKIDIVIVTTKNTGGKSSRQYADDFYDEHGFGFDEPRGDGVLFLIDMDNREAYISTCGRAIQYFTDARINSALEEIVSCLKNGYYDDACKQFLEHTEYYMKNEPLRGVVSYTYGQRVRLILQKYWFMLLLLSAGIAAGCVALLAHSSRSSKVSASRYFDGSKGFHLENKIDQLINEVTTSRKIPQNNNTGSGGGGSSVHKSSSGTTHGGGGKSF